LGSCRTNPVAMPIKSCRKRSRASLSLLDWNQQYVIQFSFNQRLCGNFVLFNFELAEDICGMPSLFLLSLYLFQSPSVLKISKAISKRTSWKNSHSHNYGALNVANSSYQWDKGVALKNLKSNQMRRILSKLQS
jgi:hypothetical protein